MLQKQDHCMERSFFKQESVNTSVTEYFQTVYSSNFVIKETQSGMYKYFNFGLYA